MNVNFNEMKKTGIHDIFMVTKCVTSMCNGTGDYSTNSSCYILVISSLLGDIVLHGIVASLPGDIVLHGIVASLPGDIVLHGIVASLPGMVI